MGHALGIAFTHMSRDKMMATMPVNEHTVQPFRVLHGGASVVLAETLASVGAWMNLHGNDKTAVGIEINANHIRSVPEGRTVTGIAEPIQRGRSIHVWKITIEDEKGRLVCESRCTLAIVERTKG
ncbi:MAG: hotdog fold thioesterase [Bacteroidota bacterium]